MRKTRDVPTVALVAAILAIAGVMPTAAQNKDDAKPPAVPKCAARPSCGLYQRVECVRTATCMQTTIVANGCLLYRCITPDPRPIPQGNPLKQPVKSN